MLKPPRSKVSARGVASSERMMDPIAVLDGGLGLTGMRPIRGYY